MSVDETVRTIHLYVDVRTVPFLFEHFFPIVYILAVDGEHANTTEIVPGIFIEEEPLWHYWKRMSKPVIW